MVDFTLKQQPTLLRDPQLYYEQVVAMNVMGGIPVEQAYEKWEDLRHYLKLPKGNKDFSSLHDLYSAKVRQVGAFFKTTGDDNARKDIIAGVISGDFDPDPASFKESLDNALKQVHGEYLATRSLPALQKMKIFKVKNANAGFALKPNKGMPPYSEAIALHNQSGIPRLGVELMLQAINNGGKYLQCFGDFLKTLYSVHFEVYKTIDGIVGHPETLYFMKLKGERVP
jgi:hypothetical protein